MRQQSISFQRVQYQLVSNETKLHVDIQHQRQQSDAKKSYYFCIAKTGVAVRALPTAGNTSALETEIAFNRLLPPAARQRPELVNLARTNQQSSWLGQEANNQADAKADQEQGKKEKGIDENAEDTSPSPQTEVWWYHMSCPFHISDVISNKKLTCTAFYN